MHHSGEVSRICFLPSCRGYFGYWKYQELELGKNVLQSFCLMSFWLGAQGGEVITAHQSLQIPAGARSSRQQAMLQAKVGGLVLGTDAAVQWTESQNCALLPPDFCKVMRLNSTK